MRDDPYLEGCFIYEYARESQQLIDVTSGTRMPASVSELKRVVGNFLQQFSFPSPWRALPDEQKIDLADLLPNIVNCGDRLAANIIEVDQLTDGLSNWYADVISPLWAMEARSGAFAINLAASPAAIGRAFERWAARQQRLSKETALIASGALRIRTNQAGAGHKGLVTVLNEKGTKKVRRERMVMARNAKYDHVETVLPPGVSVGFRDPGPNSWFAGLRRLGALRWKYYCIQAGKNFHSASEDPNLREARTIAYSRPSDFNQACRAAERNFREMFGASERPRRAATASWPRQTKESR